MDKLGPPTVAIITQHETEGKHQPGKGVAAHVTSIRRIPSECLDSRVKSCNYINNILAYLETKHCGAESAIMLDLHGNVSEGYANNIFAVDGSTVVTPPLGNVLAGITRDVIIELCRSQEIPIVERPLTVYDLVTGSEAFESSTLGEVVPIATIDGQVIGDGTPGPVTNRIRLALRKLIDSGRESTPIFNA
jgi:branched-chain amino acid aminotransferase